MSEVAIDDERQRLRFGPTHPLGHGAVALDVVVDGDTVVSLDAEIGFGHRGVEKLSERCAWVRLPVLWERVAEEGAALAATAACLAIEGHAGTPAPERAQWLRMLACELARARAHASRAAAVAVAVDAPDAALHAVTAGERLTMLQEALTGGRVTTGYLVVGGVRHDRPRDFSSRATL